MIDKKNFKDLLRLITLLAIMIYFVGFKCTINLLYEFLKIFNSILVQTGNNSIMTVIFKYSIVYPIVGIVLSAIGSPRGQKGKLIGKILYFIIGYFVGFALDFVANIVF